MKNFKNFIIFALFSITFLNNASAQIVFTNTPKESQVIPDAGQGPCNSSPGAFLCLPVVVSGLPANAFFYNSFAEITHSWRGDLVMEVRAPNGASFRPFSRPGAVSANDCGSGIQLSASETLTFQDFATGNFWTTVANPSPTGTYFPSQPLTGSANNTQSQTFSGQTNGTWQVCFQDVSYYEKGVVKSAGLSFITTTAANVSLSGRVTANGRGIRGVRITTRDSSGNTRSTSTSSFGYYTLDELEAGETYIVTASNRRYVFSNNPRIVNMVDNISDEDFNGSTGDANQLRLAKKRVAKRTAALKARLLKIDSAAGSVTISR